MPPITYSSKSFDIEIVTDPERFKALKPEWDALWSASSRQEVFRSFDCCLYMWQAVAHPAGRKLFCLVGWEKGRMVAAWPLVTYRKFVWKIVRSLDASGVEFSDILISDAIDQPGWVRAAWRLAAKKSRADLFVLPYVRTGTSLHSALPCSRRAAIQSDVNVFAHLKEEGDWSSYYASLSRSHRRHHAKAQRRFAELGNVRVEMIQPSDPRCPDLVRWMLSQKRIWAERAGKKGLWLFSDAYQEFLTELLRRPIGGPKPMIMALMLDGAPVAVNMISAGKNTLEGLIAAFDARYEKYSPGALLIEHIVKWALEHGLNFDFGNGDAHYKRFWSRGSIIETTTYEVPLSWWGFAALQLKAMRKQPGKPRRSSNDAQPAASPDLSFDSATTPHQESL